MNKTPAACLRSLVILSALALTLLGTALPATAQQAYYIHADHLNTPRLIENQSQQVVWRWDNDDPFGGNIVNANPSGLGTFEFNLRFPGQYFDKETSLHYNYFRDYSPEIGRYIQSDPIGLAGGMNTYAYVDSNPFAKVDPDGLTPTAVLGAQVGSAFGPAGTAIGAVAGWVIGAWLGEKAANLTLATPGNVADTQITQDYNREASEKRLCNEKPDDPCEWLKNNASSYRPDQVKATEKAWGCRRSRHGR